MTISAPANLETADPSRFHILVVEDEDQLREMIVEELNDVGYTTRQARDGVEALKAILEEPPDLVLSDITMPNMNGHELLKEVRQAQDNIGEVDFVFLSALADKEQVLEGLHLGADDYLTKPIDYDMLIAKVEGRLREVVRRRGEQERHLVKLYKALSPKEESAAQDQESPSSKTADPARFKHGLAQIAQNNGNHVVAGHLQVIGLDGIKQRLDEKWPPLAEQVNQTAERTIQARLAPQDVLTRNDDGDFVVCFSQLTEREAAATAQSLTNDIWNNLLGAIPEAESLTVTAEVQTLEIAPAEIEQTEDLLSTVTSRLAGMAARVRGQATATLAELHRSAQLELLPVLTNSGRAANLVIAAFDPLSKTNIDYVTQAKGDTSETAADVDILTLGKVCEHIYGSIHEKSLIVTPVHYQTISSKKLAKKFIGLCEDLLPVAKERLIFNVREIPQNLLANDLSIARLSAYSKCRMVELGSAELGNADLQNLRVNLVCMTYGTLAPLLRPGHQRIETLLGHIHDSKARLLIYNIPPQAKNAMSKQAFDLLSFHENRAT